MIKLICSLYSIYNSIWKWDLRESNLAHTIMHRVRKYGSEFPTCLLKISLSLHKHATEIKQEWKNDTFSHAEQKDRAWAWRKTKERKPIFYPLVYASASAFSSNLELNEWKWKLKYHISSIGAVYCYFVSYKRMNGYRYRSQAQNTKNHT